MLKNVLRINKLVLLYLFSAISLLLVVYVVPVLASYKADTWEEFYRMLGKLMGIWGTIFGTSVILFAILASFLFIYFASIRSFVIRLTRIEAILMGMFLMNGLAMIVGIARGAEWNYILGDTLKGSYIPLFYLWAKKALNNREKIISFAKLVLTVEIILFIIFAATELIPFAQSTRTFLYTVAFTLFYEEERILPRVVFFLLTLFALYIVISTNAFRGTVIIFILIVALNIALSYRSRMSPMFIVAFTSVILMTVLALSFVDLKLDKNVTTVSKRFEETLEGDNRKFFGLEESVFQRVGETMDVFLTFQQNNVMFFIVGFGNGAELNNTFITPSERSVYRSQVKHNIYITLLGILYRQGLIGFLLYSGLFLYIFQSILYFYRHRLALEKKIDYVYLKVFTLYHFSTVLYSNVAYLFVGNIVLSFTLPIHILLREQMFREIKAKNP